jgi:2'-5' RNA ligase
VQRYAPPMDRLFFALVPDEPTRAALVARVADLRRAHGGAGWVAAEKLHVTLAFLGSTDAFAAALATRAAAVAARLELQGFEMSLAHLGSFAGSRCPWFLAPADAAAATAMALRLRVALREAGIEFDARPFVPHLTIRRAREPAPALAIAPVAWLVRDFALLHSDPRSGAYATLGRWPLAR